jgi:hypothetical protein
MIEKAKGLTQRTDFLSLKLQERKPDTKLQVKPKQQL